MKFVADVNIAQSVIKLLRQNAHDVLDIKKQNPKTPDINIIKQASKEKKNEDELNNSLTIIGEETADSHPF